MSFIEASPQTSYPDEFSDTVAKVTASILQEQLAPIFETLREHARSLDLHAALLNHSTAMNRYNVGKTDDIRDFQNNINFKLQFYVHPEDRWYPNYRNPRTPLVNETISNAESRLPAADAHTHTDEPTTHSTVASSSSVAATPGSPDRPSTPAATEHADSRPTTPRQQLGDGFSVVPGPSRRLQRERPFSVAPDPMWNSSQEIRPYELLATTHAPPPPYVLPPTYAEVVPPGQIEAVEAIEEVVHSEPEPFPTVETIEIEPSTSQSPALDVRDVSVSSTESGEVDSGDENRNHVESQLSEKARGKKRMREEDYSESPDDLLGGCCSSGSRTSSDRDGQPNRKRMKTDTDTDTDTRISTDRVEVDDSVLMVARMGLFETLTDVESYRQVKKLKEIQKLYRGGRLSLA